MSTILPRTMVLQEFLPYVGHRFVANCNPRPVELTLVEATPLRGSDAVERPPFILIFHSNPDTVLVGGTYELACGGFGPDLITIHDMIPPAKAQAGYYYQAVFN